jgi:hypothetical protein
MPTDPLFSFVLWIHIVCGCIALVVAPGAMLTRKGGTWHRRWGLLFVGSMAVVAATAAVMSVLRSGLFLGLVAVFSFYFVFTGVRVLKRKSPNAPVPRLDWIASAGTLAACLGLTLYGAWHVVHGDGFGTVALGFGLLGSGMAGADLYRFAHPPEAPRAWFFSHMQRMLGAYIATVTAFSVVNLEVGPPLLHWLGPTGVGSIGIAVWVRTYKRRFARARAAG